ncbi:MAG: pyridoxamine 5'-phosphate oxidase family protein, partial [Chloroflexota bacterium]|nr:pyridoxamine 5'-phosphate oxidase family protein [Chloroflexota bacterium]
MPVTLDTSTQRGQHVEQRLNDDVIAWLTTVRPSGQPDSVPVWFLWQDGKIVVYSRPDQTKMRNLTENPKVTLTIDNTNG